MSNPEVDYQQDSFLKEGVNTSPKFRINRGKSSEIIVDDEVCVGAADKLMGIRFEARDRKKKDVLKRSICGNPEHYNAVISA